VARASEALASGRLSVAQADRAASVTGTGGVVVLPTAVIWAGRLGTNVDVLTGALSAPVEGITLHETITAQTADDASGHKPFAAASAAGPTIVDRRGLLGGGGAADAQVGKLPLARGERSKRTRGGCTAARWCTT
jgi:hypothetical protein